MNSHIQGATSPTQPAGAGATRAISRSSVLVRALLAYSVHEHQDDAGAATRVTLRLQPRACSIEDDGRGIGLHRDGYVVGLLEQLAARRPEVALHGIGLAMIAMAAPLLTIESRRNGRLFTQSFAWGVAQGHVQDVPWDGASGTRICMVLPDDAPEINFDEVIEQVDLWRDASPALQFDASVERPSDFAMDGAHADEGIGG